MWVFCSLRTVAATLGKGNLRSIFPAGIEQLTGLHAVFCHNLLTLLACALLLLLHDIQCELQFV